MWTRAVPLVLFAVIAGCGARSELESWDVDGGGGNAPPAGGGSSACSRLEVREPWARLASETFAAFAPKLVWTPSATGDTRMTVAFAWDISPDLPDTALHHVSFSPTPPWPTTLESGIFVDSTGGRSFDAAPSTSGFALGFVDETGARFSPFFSPGKNSVGGDVLLDGAAEAMLFVEQAPHNPIFHVVGYRSPIVGDVGTYASLRVVWEAASGVQTDAPVDIACAAGPVVADAVALGDGWLVATSTAVESPCNSAPADDIRFFLAGIAGLDQLDAIDARGTVVELHAAPSGDGAWVVWLTEDQRLHGVRLGASGNVLGDLDLVDAELELGGLALANAGDHMLLATAAPASVCNDGARMPPCINVYSYAETGAMRGSASVPGRSNERLDLIGDSSGRRGVIAFAELAEGPSLAVAEICIPPATSAH